MQTHYSIIYANIRPSIAERISIGLLLWSNEQAFFQFSKQKLELFRELVAEEAFKLVRSTLSNLSEKIKNEASNLFPSTSPISNKEIDYLSRYCNNLLVFSAPTSISVIADPDNFQKLFQLFISEAQIDQENIAEVNEQEEFIQKIRTDFYPTITQRVNTDLTITSDNLPTLILPVPVNFIGKNDVPVAGKAVFFDKRSYNLNNDIAIFINLIRSFEANGENAGKYYIIGNEPIKTNDGRHQIWEQIRKNTYIELVPTNEIDQITNYMNTHGVEPFIKAKPVEIA